MSLKRGILYTFLAQAPTLVLYFVSSTFMTRLLGDVGRGEYALLTNQVAALAILVNLNLGFGVTYFTAKAQGDVGKAIGAAASMLLVDLVVTPLILRGCSSSVTLTEMLMPADRTHWLYWGFIYLSVMLGLLNTTISSVLLGLKRFNVLNVMSILNAALSAIGFLLLFLFGDRVDAREVLPAVLIVSTIVMLVQSATWCVLYAVYVKRAPVPTWAWAELKPILAFSMMGHLSNVINLINYRFDVWVVHTYSVASQLGLYAAAVGIAQLLFYVPEPFSRVVQPYLFGQVKDEMISRFKAVARLNFTALLVLAGALAVVAHWAVPLLYGDEFAPSVGPLRLLLPGIIFMGAAKLLTQLVVQGGLQRFNLLATSLAAVLTIALDFLLIPTWGIYGAAVATSIAYGVTLLTLLYTIRSRLGIPVHDLFLLRPSDLSYLRQRTS